MLRPPQAAQEFEEDTECAPCGGIGSAEWLAALVASPNVQEVIGLDSLTLQARLSKKWTAESALKDCKVPAHDVVSLGTDRCIRQL